MQRNEAAFVERLAVLAEAEGLPRIAGRLLGLMMLSPGERSLDELAAELRVSRGSVSGNGRLLAEAGLLERVSRAGDRRVYYRTSSDVAPRMLARTAERLREMRDFLGAAEAELSRRERPVEERLYALYRAYDRAASALEEAVRGPRRGRGEASGRNG